MSQTASVRPPIACNPEDRPAHRLHFFISGLALASLGLVLITLRLDVCGPGIPGWPEAALVLTTTLATLVSLARQSAGQNVILAAAIIAGIGGAAHGLGAVLAIPLDPFSHADDGGALVLNTRVWPIPLIWIIAILNSRGVARLILRPWRTLRNYGFRVIGITAALTVLFEAALEPFAAGVKNHWHAGPAGFSIGHAAPPANLLGWLVTTLLILAFTTPVLINKRQQLIHSPPDYHPLVVWLLALALFAGGAVMHRLWLEAGYCGMVSLAAALFAIRGARG